MTFKTLILTTLAVGGLIAAIPHQAEARVIVNFNTAPSCQGFTRTFIDNYGYQRTSNGTACLQPNGSWQVVSESVNPLPYYYNSPVVYQTRPTYYGPTAIIIRDRDRNVNWNRGRDHGRDNDDHHGDDHHGHNRH